jgi:hypothetical protein
MRNVRVEDLRSKDILVEGDERREVERVTYITEQAGEVPVEYYLQVKGETERRALSPNTTLIVEDHNEEGQTS